MNYSINIKFISVPWFEEIIRETLDMYLNGGDLIDSPYVKKGRQLVYQNKWHRDFMGAKPEDYDMIFLKRCNELANLYVNMKVNGYNGSPLCVWFDRNGYLHLNDGFHRLAILKYLGYQGNVNVTTEWWNKDFDFPLRGTMENLIVKGKYTYEPINDIRLADFKPSRPDSYKRLEYVLGHLVGKTVLDIGCSEGFFTRGMVSKGYKVTGIDIDAKRLAVARYLTTINSVEADYKDASEEMKGSYDNILYLSVFHNNITAMGLPYAVHRLRKLRGKAKRLFLEVPNGDKEWQWKQTSAGAPLYHFKGKEFESFIQNTLHMQITAGYNDYRPMYVLDATDSAIPDIRPIPDAQWQAVSKWEQKWWGDCTNTSTSEKLQDCYARWMKVPLDLQGMSVIDIGGGPVSILLRCKNFSRAVVADPISWPDWVRERYRQAGIELIKISGEMVDYSKTFDEAWIYNTLQHVRDPELVIRNAIASAKKIRVFEPIEAGEYNGHPHNLTQEALDNAFGKEGIIVREDSNPKQPCYCGVFDYAK